MILLWGADGIMIYNDGYAAVAAQRHPEILGGKVLEGWPEIAEFNRHNISVCLNGGTLSYHDQPLVLMRNRVREQAWFDLFYSPVRDPMAVPQAVIAVVIEKTNLVLMQQQRDTAEQALRASNHALQHANADLEQFAFSASHDLQEPLRMVSVYSQLLKRKLAGKLDAESEILLRHCVDGAQRLDSLIKGLLEYTRASSESISELSEVNAADALQGALDNLLKSIQDSGAVIFTDALPTLRIHALHLQQIFQNLISNAIKYRSKQPPRIHIGSARTEDAWRFSVSDNGIGVDPAYQEQIFGLFKRLHGSSEYAGTGLGLAICKKLVERYRGRIWIDSKLGEGATFYFTLPFAD